MAKPLRINPLTAALLDVAVGALERIAPPGVAAQSAEHLLAAVAGLIRALRTAGKEDSDGGRDVTAEETRLILGSLLVGLDAAAAKIAPDAVSVAVPPWLGPVCSAVGALVVGDGVIAVIGATLRRVGEVARDGLIDAAEVVYVIGEIRAAAGRELAGTDA